VAAPITRQVEVKDIDCPAVVTSRESRVISAETDGAVMALLVHADQYVHAGDLIAQLDVSTQRAKLEEAKGQKARAQGEAGRAYAVASQAAHKARIEQRLVRSGASSPEAVHSAFAEVSAAGADGAAASGSIKSADATIAQATLEIDAANVKAPIDGIISNVKVLTGTVAHKGTVIAQVFNPADTIVKIAVPTAKQALVRPGQRVELTYNNDRKVTVTIDSITVDHDPAIDFVQAVAKLDNPRPDDIHVGITGHVRLVDKGAVR
jgi:RND family efflux transporter MFP subunit